MKRETKSIDTHIYMPQWLLDAVRKLAKQNRRSVTAEITIAVEDRIAAQAANGGRSQNK